MSNSRRRYRAIVTKLVQLHGYPSGRIMQRVQVLAGFISGIVGSQSTHCRAVAKHAGLGAKVDSREKRLSRWYQNEQVTYELDYLPYLQEVLAGLAGLTLPLAMDGSEIGRGCMVLMISLLYNNRAIPLAWTVFQRPKGHASAEEHIHLLEVVRPLLPAASEIIFLGDGEFDSVALQTYLHALPQWSYVCRTAKNTQIMLDGAWTTLDALAFAPDTCLTLEEVLFTAQAYGPVQVVLHWNAQYAEPLYLVTNFELGEEAGYWYQQRMRIETFFSDQKSRGFQLHKSHISDPMRLARLLIAACLAYVWMIYLGTQAHLHRLVPLLHRADRCDLSLFQLGLDLLHYYLEEDLEILVDFSLPESFFRVQ
ncbi:MAG: transposase [Ktedonobacteraceae bacterium]|nr:transposase [Ktedonobacteraceae bacterium]